jgi:hypothetical protein
MGRDSCLAIEPSALAGNHPVSTQLCPSTTSHLGFTAVDIVLLPFLFTEKFAWKLIDLATVARIGEETKVVSCEKPECGLFNS